jgi:hypothetical protein
MTEQAGTDVFADLLARIRQANGTELAALSEESYGIYSRDELTADRMREIEGELWRRLHQLLASLVTEAELAAAAIRRGRCAS